VPSCLQGQLGSLKFTVMDTGGLEDEGSLDAVENKMLSHTAAAIAHADIVLFMVDAETGVTPEEVKFSRCVARGCGAERCGCGACPAVDARSAARDTHICGSVVI
jgi:predicted GTPase